MLQLRNIRHKILIHCLPIIEYNSTRSFSSQNFNSATHMLKLSNSESFTGRELRDAYFTAAKLCHPDLNKTKSNDELTERFLKITEAYEFLQKYDPSKKSRLEDDEMELSNIITKSEEHMYRDACRECLGLDAETVEESKRCPLFRDWLRGKTDAAFTWSNFFMNHGGLSPMLRKRNLSLGEGDNSHGRRRRKPGRSSLTR